MNKVNSDVAYEFIRKRILSGEFPPGLPLMTESLSGLTKVSRTPVREALHRLRAEGLVSIQPRLGASVKMMDVKEFREMCELRLALEGHAAALAAQNHSAADLREIKFALEAMRKLTDRILASTEEAPFFDELSRQDVRFHIAIMAAAKNDLMKREILRLHLLNKIVAQRKPRPGQVSKAESDENRRRVMASHDEIFQAIEAGDPVATKAAMEKHIQDIIDKSVNAFSKSSALVPRELTEEELVYGV